MQKVTKYFSNHLIFNSQLHAYSWFLLTVIINYLPRLTLNGLYFEYPDKKFKRSLFLKNKYMMFKKEELEKTEINVYWVFIQCFTYEINV